MPDNNVTEQNNEYLLEKTLAGSDPELHKRFRDTVFAVQKILSRYRLLFPEYTDHSELHSLTVIDSCNQLIGRKQMARLNSDEIYILLLSSYLHDSGMGIGEKDYEEFKDRLDADSYFRVHPDAGITDFVRDYHNEFSGMFIEKYAGLFEFPGDEYTFAVKQVVRGHRKTDLFDEKEYPSSFILPNGNIVCLPYLAALIRLADEIDVAASRNPLVLFDLGMIHNAKSLMEHKKLAAVEAMEMTEEAFILTAKTEEEEIRQSLLEMVDKMQGTLDLCRDVIHKRTDFILTQKRVVLDLR